MRKGDFPRGGRLFYLIDFASVQNLCDQIINPVLLIQVR